jgi:uncharacterized protein with PQ loop repeat
MTVAVLFVTFGTAVGLVRALPQLLRLLRGRDARGVSADAAATTSVVSLAWTAYGLLTGQGAVASASGASAVMFALVAAAALRLGRSPRELRAAPVWLAVLTAAGAVGGARGLGFLLPVSVLVANGPQLLVAWRERELSALSLGTWRLAVLEAVVWGAYGLAAGDRSIVLYGTLHLATSGAIVALRLAKAGRDGAPAGAPARPHQLSQRSGAGAGELDVTRVDVQGDVAPVLTTGRADQAG